MAVLQRNSPCRPGRAESSAGPRRPPGPRCTSGVVSATICRAAMPARRSWPRGCGSIRCRGELIDLSMLESHVMGLTYYPVTYFEMLGRPWRDARKLTVPRIARASDGLVGLGCGTAQQWFDLCAMTGHGTGSTRGSPLSITEQANEGRRTVFLGRRAHRCRVRRLLRRSASRTRRWQRRHHRIAGPLLSPADRSSANPAGFRQPGHPYRISGVQLRPPVGHPHLGSTPTTQGPPTAPAACR